LARPDLLERAPGASVWGEFHYIPGDVKSARTTRSDAVFQVGFAAVLLAAVQGRRPDTGFLVLGDGRREDLDLGAIRCTIDDAVSKAEAVSRGETESSPYFSSACARCRWRGTCLPQLEEARDLSFVHGVTRARRRVLRGHGVQTIDDLARADLEALIASGVPSDGLDRMRAQAKALLDGRVSMRPPVGLPHGATRELYVRIETDPLDHGEPFSIAWGEAVAGGSMEDTHVALVSTPVERVDAFRRLIGALESPLVRGEPVYTFGGGTSAAFDALAENAHIDPARSGDLAGRFVDLAPWVRRAAVLPVFRYRFDEVAAVARGLARPSPGTAEDALFVLHAGLTASPDPAAVRHRLEESGCEALASLHAIRGWFAS
jgi:uncharacterized protein